MTIAPTSVCIRDRIVQVGSDGIPLEFHYHPEPPAREVSHDATALRALDDLAFRASLTDAGMLKLRERLLALPWSASQPVIDCSIVDHVTCGVRLVRVEIGINSKRYFRYYPIITS